MGTLTIQSVANPMIIGTSKGMRLALEACRKAACDNYPILFQGEIGTGKFLLATFIHHESGLDKPFFVVDCADPTGSISDLLSDALEWERRLRFLQGGTIYFREVASLTLVQQARLYELCTAAVSLGIRVLLSSSQNIHLLVYEQAFDPRLYSLVSQHEIAIVPLRQRCEDLPLLTEYLIKRLNLSLRKSIQGLTPRVEQVFMGYHWPGNVEEVQHVLTRAMLLATEPYIEERHLTEYLGQMGDDFLHTPEVMSLERMEEILLRSALNRYGSTLEGKKRAARALNISLATLYNKVKRYNLGK